MPNYCKNKLVVEGPSDVLELFLSTSSVLGKEFSFMGIVDPYTVDSEPLIEEAPFPIHDPVMYMWGTNRDAVDPEIVQNTNNCVRIDFDTAWSPPNKWAKNVLTDPRFQALTITIAYCENGLRFYGEYIVNIDEVQNNHNRIKSTDLEYDENIDDYILHKNTDFFQFVKKWGFTEYGG